MVIIFLNHLNNEIQVNWCSKFNKIKFYVRRPRALVTFYIVRCILDLVNRARPEYASANFVLMTTFPNKELTDENQSLADAKLLNAVIVQRMKWLFQHLNLVMNFSSQSYLPLGIIKKQNYVAFLFILVSFCILFSKLFFSNIF